MFSNRKLQGRINHPRNHALVPRHFRAEGSIELLPAGQHLFLVVQVGGLMWPKGEVQVNDTTWTSQVYEGGTPPHGRFTLALYVVSAQGYSEITAWLEHGKLTGDYPGLGRVKGGVRLHSVELRLAA